MVDSVVSFTYEGEPMRLDRVLVKHMEGEQECSRSQVERWIESGCVSVNNNKVIKPAHKVSAGDRIALAGAHDEATPLEPFELPLDILYEDKYLLVIHKPAGLSMHPGAGNRCHTLANAVVSHVGQAQLDVGESDRPGIVHRLDKDTTGVVVVAKSTPVHAALSKQFAERTVERTYVALVYTTPRGKRPVQLSDLGEVDAPIGRHASNRKLMTVSESGKHAVTHWRVIERFVYGTLLDCRLKTGRTHQIRVHMDSIGCPVIGDSTYGDFSNLPARLREEARRFGRQALHAASLGFIHPISREKLSFFAPLPHDLAQLVEEFRRLRSS